jgi:hypothetical protein
MRMLVFTIRSKGGKVGRVSVRSVSFYKQIPPFNIFIAQTLRF